MKKKKAQSGIKVKTDALGYWNPENWGKPVNIPSNEITMRGVEQPLLGISNTGDTQMMFPNNEYKFNGENVVEFPISKDMKKKKAQSGKRLKFLQPTDKNLPAGRIHPFFPEGSSERAISIGGENGQPAYLIPSFKYGAPLADPEEEFRKTGEHLGGPFETYQEADKWGEEIRHPYVEKDKTIPSPLKTWGDMKTKSKKGKVKKAQGGLAMMLGKQSTFLPKVPKEATFDDNIVQPQQSSVPDNKVLGTIPPQPFQTQGEISVQQPIDKMPTISFGQNAQKQPTQSFAQTPSAQITPQPPPVKNGGIADVLGSLPLVGGIISGIGKLGEQKKMVEKAKRQTNIASLNAEAAASTPKEEIRKYVRPEDSVISGNNRYPADGTGTDILAKYGKKVPKAFLGSIMSALGGGGGGVTAPQNQEAGAQIGESIGGMASMIPGIGAIAGPLASAAGKLIGGMIDTTGEQLAAEQDEQNKIANKMMAVNFSKGIQNQHKAYMKDGGKMAYGGDLTVDNGSIQPISENPYSSGTMEFKGPSHDDGGILANYGGNPIEAEGGEPVYVDGNELTIFGNLPITKESAAIIGDKRAAGKKFKTFGKIIADDERKVNNIQKRSLDKLDEIDERTTFGKVTMNSLLANDIGTKMKLKEAAAKKEKAGMLQEFFNTTSEKQGLSAEHLAKGQVKKAKKGANIEKARLGTTGLPVETYTQFLPEATIKPQPSDVQKLMMEEGIKAIMRGEKPLFPIPTNSQNVSDNTLAKNREKLIAQNRERLSPAVSQHSSSPSQQTSAPQSSGAFRQPSSGNSSYTSQYGLPYGRDEYSTYQQMIDRKAEDQFSIPKQTKSNSKSPLYGGVSFKDITNNWPKEVLQDAKLDISKPDSWTAADIQRLQSVVKTKYPQMYSQLEDKSSDTTDLFGVDWYSLELQKPKIPDSESEETPKLVPNPDVITNKTTEKEIPKEILKEIPKETPKQEKAKNKIPWQLIGDAISSFTKRKYREGLDWRQLAGEMAAMRDHEEPVYAQLFSPELDTPYDISFQDRLNENTATTRALSRGMGYNPAAMSTLASQKYAADSGVLAEQFRANQAKKDQVYSKNRDILNSAKLTNLGILDKQQERQATAKSNTKANRQAALSSMASKYLQNDYENKQLGVLENLYPNFGFDRSMNALNQGFSFFSAPRVGSAPVEENEGDNKKAKEKRKGGIVKAIKHL